MRLNRLNRLNRLKRLKKPFWKTMMWHQNSHHKHGVIIHTLKVAYHLAEKGNWKMVPAGLLHDIAKPLSAYQDEKDIREGLGDYSFTNHEIFGWYLIKDVPFISDYTKDLVRHHYLIRGMSKAKKKGNYAKYRRLKRIWDKLDDDFKKDLKTFMTADDRGKK